MMLSNQPDVRAILGPTNTGKTYLAMERMMEHPSGVIGFPLRLLARENYDRLVTLKGKNAVALITGEEKIIPDRARWFVCTVEAMPTDQVFDFVAVDEIQMCTNPERGHIFTDRLLYMRGTTETLFLGSDTILSILRRLIPDIYVETRPRFSMLTYSGAKNMARLPKRSAIVAFALNDVYAIAEHMRQQRGGSALVLGALSPKTRNQQVAMYQAGEVDYLVATDAIGMGLNMDVNHVAFASHRKFDGRLSRDLLTTEIAQIAGRAGRHTQSGTFGVTNGLGDFPMRTIESVETHTFAPDKFIYWRNKDLNFNSPQLLLKSLRYNPDIMGLNLPCDILRRIHRAEDSDALESLILKDTITQTATTPDTVQLLWEVCQIPDFCQISAEMHADFLETLYLYLVEGLKTEHIPNLPDDFVASHVEKLNCTDGTIDTLTARLANVRTWAYIAHKDYWLSNSKHWQHRTGQIENLLSDTLHQRLMSRFVDERKSVLLRKENHSHDDLVISPPDHQKNRDIMLHGHKLGSILGITFSAHDEQDSVDQDSCGNYKNQGSLQQSHKNQKHMLSLAMPVLMQLAPQIMADLENAPHKEFNLNMQTGDIYWRGGLLATLIKGPTLHQPNIMMADTFMEGADYKNRLKTVAQSIAMALLDKYLKPVFNLSPHINKMDTNKLSAYGRAILYHVHTGLGSCDRHLCAEQYQHLTDQDKKYLSKLGIRIGVWSIYMQAIKTPNICRTRALLACIFYNNSISQSTFKVNTQSPIPSLLTGDILPPKLWHLAGYIYVAPPKGIQGHGYAIRVDDWENITHKIRQNTHAKKCLNTPELQHMFGGDDNLQNHIMATLGYKPIMDENNTLTGYQQRRPKGIHKKDKNLKKSKAEKSSASKQKTWLDKTHSPFAGLQDLIKPVKPKKSNKKKSKKTKTPHKETQHG